MPGVKAFLAEVTVYDGWEGDVSSSVDKVVKRCEAEVQGSGEAEEGAAVEEFMTDRFRGRRGMEKGKGGGSDEGPGSAHR